MLRCHHSWQSAAWWEQRGCARTVGRGGATGEGLWEGLSMFPPAFWGGCKVLSRHLLTYVTSFSKDILRCEPLKCDLRRAVPALIIRHSPERSKASEKSQLPLLWCLIYTTPQLHHAPHAVIVVQCNLRQPWGCCQRELRQVRSHQG